MTRTQFVRTWLIVVVVGVGSTRGADQLLWDNGMAPDGITGAPIPVPVAPNLLVLDDFIVPEGESWVITGFHYVMCLDADFDDNGVTEVCVWSDSDGEGPLSVVYDWAHGHRKRFVGMHFGLKTYEYRVDDLNIILPPGSYWIGPEAPAGIGVGSGYWVTTGSERLERNQLQQAAWSNNSGEKWFSQKELGWEGDYGHLAFRVFGHPVGGPGPEAPIEEDDWGWTEDASELPPAPPDDPPPPPEFVEHERLIVDDTTCPPSELLWDNNHNTNGVMGRALSPPSFPNIRVVDDLIVLDSGWVLRSLHLYPIEDTTWQHGGVLSTYIHAHRKGSGPGELLHYITKPFTRMATGDTYFGRPGYEYWLEDLYIPLDQGRYWVGFRNDLGGGSGTNYWMTSDGGRDGMQSSTGYFSLDAGQNWQAEGPGWHHAWEARGFVRTHEEPRPFAFEVPRGQHVSGGTFALRESDDDRLVIEARRPSSVSQPSVQVVFEGRTERSLVDCFSFLLESHASFAGVPITQWIDVYDFDSANWVRIDERPAAEEDTLVVISVVEDVQRFVGPNGALRARVGYWDPGAPIVNWRAAIDQAIWIVSP
jgi:hypothetical protein